mmetsp:Transcript_27022/g.37606  ORF Transcript_27022/g.37606 Transcript_27022/m.37606 type:complete len:152 (-) Transcript_27022:383-838(-)
MRTVKRTRKRKTPNSLSVTYPPQQGAHQLRVQNQSKRLVTGAGQAAISASHAACSHLSYSVRACPPCVARGSVRAAGRSIVTGVSTSFTTKSLQTLSKNRSGPALHAVASVVALPVGGRKRSTPVTQANLQQAHHPCEANCPKPLDVEGMK